MNNKPELVRAISRWQLVGISINADLGPMGWFVLAA